MNNYNPYNPEVKQTGTPEKIPDGWEGRTKERRALVQMFNRLKKTIEAMYELRQIARKAKRLDDVQQYTEAIEHAKLSITYLRQVARRRFSKSLEELEGYK